MRAFSAKIETTGDCTPFVQPKIWVKISALREGGCGCGRCYFVQFRLVDQVLITGWRAW